MRRPGMDAPGHVDHLKAVLKQEAGHLHAATTMVAKAGNRAGFVEFVQACRDGLHGHVQKVHAFGLGAGGLNLPALAHIEQDGALVLLAGPFSDLGRINLLHVGLRI